MYVRPATAGDLEIIVGHRVAMFRDIGHTEDVLAQVEIVSRDLLRPALEDGSYHSVLAEVEDNGVVGGAGVLILPWPGHQPHRAWIQNVYVQPEFRRRGIAREMMQTLLAWCRAKGLDSVSLHASDEGLPLYLQLGFLPTNEMWLKF
jgi:GNAT superfamily N-acetyltransferase